MKSTHIVSSFNADMEKIETLIIDMSKHVQQQLSDATKALAEEDRKLAKKVLRGDDKINKLEAELNDMALKILALRQPVAIDLRIVIMSLKMARHLERCGDYAKNMARRTRTITKAEAFTGSVGTLVRMSDMVQDMIQKMLKAYKQRDIALADEVRADDEHVDQMHNTMFRELLTYMMEDSRNVSGAIHLLLMAKNLERVGDHVADVAREITYMVTGEWPLNKRSKDDHTSKMIIDPTSDEAFD